MPTTTNTKSSTKFLVFNALSAIGLTVVALGLFLIAGLITFNIGDLTSGFGLGVTVPFLGCIAVAVLVITHHMKRKWLAILLATIDLVGSLIIVILFVLSLVGEKNAFDQFGWGLLVAALVIALLGEFILQGWISSRLASKFKSLK